MELNEIGSREREEEKQIHVVVFQRHLTHAAWVNSRCHLH